MRRTTDEILIRRYLLGDLPQEERARLEDRYAADVGVFEEILAIENDLIDSYVRGELAEIERQEFEAEFLKSPQRRERIEFARALGQVSALAKHAAPPHQSSPWTMIREAFAASNGIAQWALAATGVVVVAGGLWLLVQNHSLRVGLRQAQAEQAELRNEADTLRQHIAEIEGNPRNQVLDNQQGSDVAKLESPTGPELILRLTPGMARSPGEPQKTIVVPPTAFTVRLRLILDRDDYKTYEAVLSTAEQKEVLRGRALQSRVIGGNAVIDWRFPAHSIPSGDYIVQLAGQTATGNLEDVESYSFRLVRR